MTAQFTKLTTRAYVLPVDNIDTDQIIPARYLKATDKAGMGEALFADWRRNPDGSLRADFPLNNPAMQGAQALLAGDNFGCGSSREHAPWALIGFGLRAVISTSFADIFNNNALKNGLLPVRLDKAAYMDLRAQLQANPQAELTIDLQTQSVSMPDGTQASFAIDPFGRACLLQGVDQLGYLLNQEEAIAAYEAMRIENPC